MSTSPDRNPAPGLQRTTPAKHYSRSIIFVDEIAKHEPRGTSTSVDIISRDGINWYCQVRCGEQKSRPMGPFTKRKAEQVQDARRTRIAQMGTAWLIFERTGEDR
ncbi:hypothetical protein AM571_PC02081 (plasmid) [Rhizobium etli 8C-3]|uniref:Uncharacterized protein n=2 Tax=Rhizobium TaxID=379 RepID=A0A4R3R755_9HYPH|nr:MULTISPECIES: hypothetical protein [Rhizobium]APO79807.1 hypothetical protein AM571_PC02081 [Rhizobium etli 8C-3]TCU30601.1 hypothetical protein EV130_101172 [Rhizobium azibense]TCU41388.1 hypothetical protein EV129_101679 [Rhizobium azibense]